MCMFCLGAIHAEVEWTLSEDGTLIISGGEMKDYDAYMKAFGNLDHIYRDEGRWGAMSLTNIARSAFFSSDRTIREYADDIWHVEHR